MKIRLTFCLFSFLMVTSFVAQEAPLLEEPITTIQFEELEHNFGEIFQGSQNFHVFKFTNTGDIPLIVSKAKGSCGCTVPFYPMDPIMPGEESEIQVVYKPGKQKGQQTKMVTLFANTSPMQTIVKINAEIIETDYEVDPSIFVIDEAQQKNRELIDAHSPGCFALYPNPTSSELRLDLKEHIGRSADILIHDQMGADILTSRIEVISSEASRLDVSSFAAGIYIISIQIEGQKPMSQCFVVDK